MTMRYWLGLGLAASIFATPVVGQEETPGYSADELSAILQRDDRPEFAADELAAILSPMRTRGLNPGAGIEPGSPGSGVVPDLKVRFGFDSAELTPQARAQLDELGRALQTDALRNFKFQIGGHTDAAGSDKYNEWLSQQRASSVSAYLAEQHRVEADRLNPIGFGKRELADPNDPMSGVNRRVEVRTVE
jgi:outer membrane protein OmpA-like peptidoglycan-associated protein